MRGIVLGAVALAGAARAEDKTPCGADLICASAPATVGGAMMRAGYQGLVTKDSGGDPKIESAAAGYQFGVFFYGCAQHVNCDSLQFYVSFAGAPGRGAEFVNLWNKEKRFSQMSVRDDRTIDLRYDVSTIGGLNRTNFADVLDWWTTMLNAFDRFDAAHPAPAATSAPPAPARPKS